MAASGRKSSDRSGKELGNQRPNIIIRRDDAIEEPHHGGAWKVAYADFVTAMMAFFLLMWLINATTEAQRVGLADYFSQANVLNRGASGEGKPFGGHTPFDHGALASDRGAVRVTVGNMPVPVNIPHLPQGRQIRPAHSHGEHYLPSLPVPARKGLNSPGKAEAQERQQSETKHRFAAAAKSLARAVASDPALASLKHQVNIEQTPDGLKIQIMDTHKRPMFALGSALPNTMTRTLLARITPILTKLGHPVSIAGYTDARPYLTAGQSNWDLSVNRANATQQLMRQAGLPSRQLSEVTGYGDHDLLLPKTPFAAGNRRITILVASAPAAAAAPAPPPDQEGGAAENLPIGSAP
jgi:chemotaxis protein MotB